MSSHRANSYSYAGASEPSSQLPGALVRALRWKKSSSDAEDSITGTVVVPSPPWFSNFGEAPPASRKSRLRAWRAARRASTEFHGAPARRRRSSSAEYEHSQINLHNTPSPSPSPMLWYFRNSSSSTTTSPPTSGNYGYNNMIMGCFGMQSVQSDNATSAVSTDPLPPTRPRKALY